MTKEPAAKIGYCIYIDTLLEGQRPVEWDDQDNPFVYPTLLDTQRVIAEDIIERIRQFLDGERDFDDAMTVEEYIVEVNVYPDGVVCDEGGHCFGRNMGSQKSHGFLR